MGDPCRRAPCKPRRRPGSGRRARNEHPSRCTARRLQWSGTSASAPPAQSAFAPRPLRTAAAPAARTLHSQEIHALSQHALLAGSALPAVMPAQKKIVKKSVLELDTGGWCLFNMHFETCFTTALLPKASRSHKTCARPHFVHKLGVSRSGMPQGQCVAGNCTCCRLCRAARHCCRR
jgi:hypothetical protein